jgi:hypothetical protein
MIIAEEGTATDTFDVDLLKYTFSALTSAAIVVDSLVYVKLLR